MRDDYLVKIENPAVVMDPILVDTIQALSPAEVKLKNFGQKKTRILLNFLSRDPFELLVERRDSLSNVLFDVSRAV